MRKRMLAMLLACCLIGGTLSGCGGKTENSTESSQASAETAKTEQEDTSGEKEQPENITIEFLIRSRRKQHSRHIEMRRRIFIKNIRISLQKLTQFQTAIRFSRQEWLQMMYRQSFMETYITGLLRECRSRILSRFIRPAVYSECNTFYSRICKIRGW